MTGGEGREGHTLETESGNETLSATPEWDRTARILSVCVHAVEHQEGGGTGRREGACVVSQQVPGGMGPGGMGRCLTADVYSIFEQHVTVHPPVCPPRVTDNPVWHLTWVRWGGEQELEEPVYHTG